MLKYLFLLFLISSCGCVMISDALRSVAAVSTKEVEDTRPKAILKIFNYDYTTIYAKVKATLKRTGGYIYAENTKKKMFAIYVSETDTTPVGIFFKEVDAQNTQVEVASPSTSAKELIAKRIFTRLERKDIDGNEDIEGESNVAEKDESK